MLFKPADQFKIGIAYRSRTDIRFDDADIKLGGPFSLAKTKANVRPLSLPPVLNIGLLWQPDSSWGTELVYEYVRWKEFNRFAATFSPVPAFQGIPVRGFSLPELWKSTSIVRLGGYYRGLRNWEFRSGFTFDESPIPTKTLNPAIPGADIYSLNAGVGYKWQKVSLDVGYMAAFYKSRRVVNVELEGLPATGIPFTGAGFPAAKDKYQTFNHFLAVSLTARF